MQLIKKSFLTEEELDTTDLSREELRDACIDLAGGGWTPRQANLAETYRAALLAGQPVYIAAAPNEQAVTYELIGGP
jgi:hypothetical protein